MTLVEQEYGGLSENDRPRATLSIACIRLSVSAESRGPEREWPRIGDLTGASTQYGVTTRPPPERQRHPVLAAHA
ncbi:hypothetical protein [Streptosporangium sp. NPDC049376]|uniref:hypothetical protein n=1 Tax=Streptosporangium sp. NPDC049376 TaxID=3366192 RepID=UPI0037A3F2DC